jgi:hypothetical protein
MYFILQQELVTQQLTSGTYTVFNVPNANEFYTTPSLSPRLSSTVWT